MNRQYEGKEINLLNVLFKTCLKWRGIFIFAVFLALVVGATRMAINIQALGDEERKNQLYEEYMDEMNAYEAEGLALELSIRENDRNLRNQREYNENSVLMKIDPLNEWQGSLTCYIDTDYQILPGSSVQNENPAYKITCAYADYYVGGEFYETVMGKLSFALKDKKYLKETLWIVFDYSRYAYTIGVVSESKEHCDELLRVASETMKSRYNFIKDSLGDHKLTVDKGHSFSNVNTERELYQIQQETKEKEWLQNVPELNEEYRKWKIKGQTIKLPVITLSEAIKDGIKLIIIVGVVACFVAVFFWYVVILLSGKIRDRDDLGSCVCVLGELPKVNGRKQNGIDRLVYRAFGITLKTSEYEGRIAAMAQSIRRMFCETEDENGMIALVGDLGDEEIEILAKSITRSLPDGMEIVAAGNIVTNPEAAEKAYDADGVVIVAKEDFTMRKVYQQFVDNIRICSDNLLGVVLTDCQGIS